ncbi:hypothetical protein [Methylophilus aquaticus]|uniref:Uncharacterized protein n=1 Tax=Methylophilus aquaticus TaxID=1971610 RepID=A0ABT9JTP0_9PROT|nr:hypothetical protein [Methylophilus aquaticus]MDP8567961.1 hypothetical protein [Methylophilus aquaticus]
MNSKTINREAGDKAKGFRLQKLRAAKLLLECIEESNLVLFYCAIEVIEDVALTKVSTSQTTKIFEEDKNYNPSTNFTLNTPNVLNTLVSFFDIFINQWDASPSLRFSFYTTAGIGKEKKCELSDGTTLPLLPTPVLEMLKSCEFSDGLLKMVHSVLIDEYKSQYKLRDNKGNLSTLENCSLNKFEEFLKKISWHFEQEDEDALKVTVLNLIKNSKLWNYKVHNKEEFILSSILDTLDEKQSVSDYANRFIHSSELQMIFKKAESEDVLAVLDPLWEQVKKIESEITDKRNLSEKILAVYPMYNPTKIKHLARLAARSKIEQASSNKSFLSLKYRAFEACENYFYLNGKSAISSEAELDNLIKQLQATSANDISTLKATYNYTNADTNTINAIVLDLVDSCFLAFDDTKL